MSLIITEGLGRSGSGGTVAGALGLDVVIASDPIDVAAAMANQIDVAVRVLDETHIAVEVDEPAVEIGVGDGTTVEVEIA